MEQDCLMRDESAPLLDLKMVAAAPDLHHVDEDDDNVNNENRRAFLLSSAKSKTNSARKSRGNNNHRSERVQHSSSSSSSLTDDLRSKLIDISRQKSYPPQQKKSGELLDGNFDGKRFQHRRRRRTHSFKKSNSTGSWQERREDIRRRRAALRRQSLGLSVAPYNTTQFLMEEHQGEVDEEDLVHPRRKRGDSFNSVDSFGEDYNSSSFEDDEYLHAQFCAEYDSVASERLHAMSKAELVHEYLLLEARIDSLEEELKVVKKAEETDQPMEIQATEEDIAKITVFQQEISKLLEENRRLQIENDNLQQNVVGVVTGAAGGAAEAEEESISVDDQ